MTASDDRGTLRSKDQTEAPCRHSQQCCDQVVEGSIGGVMPSRMSQPFNELSFMMLLPSICMPLNTLQTVSAFGFTGE